MKSGEPQGTPSPLQARLRSERRRLELSQQRCADEVRVSLSGWKKWEKDVAIPADKLAQLESLGFNVVFVLVGRALTTANDNVLGGLNER